MSRRLLNRGDRVAGTNRSSPSTSTTAALALPDYEPLSFPLNDSARRALGELSNNRGTAPYETQLKDSVRHLGLSVGDLHERLRTRKDKLADLQARRQEKGSASKSAEEERLEAQIPDFEAEIEELTRKSEQALRQVLDRRAELEDEAVILGELYTNAATQNPADAAWRTNNEAPDENDAEGKNTVASVLDTFRDMRAKKEEAYVNLGPHQRYALNNDYAGFKKLWHDAAAGEDGPPLPDASRWFLTNGEPDMRIPGRDGQQGALDDDDDVAVSRENISINCPLTLLPMAEPYSNRKCPHTFEKVAILDYLPAHGVRQCPQTGCSQTFSRARFEDDFFLDDAMVRRIQRSKQAEQDHDNDMDDDDDDDDDADESLVVGTQRRVRGGAGQVMKRERPSTVDLDEV